MAHYTYLQPVPYEIDAAEVLRELAKRAHLVLRIETRGRFPHRALEPFARIEHRDKAHEALFCEIADDESALRAYFPTDVPLSGQLTLGYGSEIVAVIPLDRLKLKPAALDEKKIAERFHRVTIRDPGAFRVRR